MEVMTHEKKEKILAALERGGLAIELSIVLSELVSGKPLENKDEMRSNHKKIVDLVKTIETKEMGTDASIPNPC